METISAEAPQVSPTLGPWSRYFSADGVYLRPPVDPKHARIWARVVRFLRWGAVTLTTLVIASAYWPLRMWLPDSLWLVLAGFLLATFQLLGAQVALLALDPPALPPRLEWERSLSLFVIVMLLFGSCGLLLIAMGTTCYPAMLLRRRGWRVVYAPNYVTGRSEATFSLSTLFGLMTCVAVLSGIASAFVRLGGMEGARQLVALMLLVGFGVSPLAWFLPRPVNWWAGAIAICLLTGIVVWLNQGTREMGALLVTGTNLAVGHGVAIAVQRAGFRLLRLPPEMRRPIDPFGIGEPE